MSWYNTLVSEWRYFVWLFYSSFISVLEWNSWWWWVSRTSCILTCDHSHCIPKGKWNPGMMDLFGLTITTHCFTLEYRLVFTLSSPSIREKWCVLDAGGIMYMSKEICWYLRSSCHKILREMQQTINICTKSTVKVVLMNMTAQASM